MARSKIRITKKLVDGLQPSAREYLVHDADLRGFACRVWPSGRKAFVVFYRARDGRQRRPVIGRYGAIAVDQARAIARSWLARVAQGGDPSLERKQARKAMSMVELGQKFVVEYAEVFKKPSSQRQDCRLIERQINPTIGARKVESITRADIQKIHHDLRETPYEANRVLALLSKMFNLAEAWGLRPDGTNPVRHVRRFTERKRERFLTPEELERVGRVIAQMQMKRREPANIFNAIMLLALTGCRVGEILGLRWEWYDPEGGLVRLPDSKTGGRTVALSVAAMGILDSIERTKHPNILLGEGNAAPLTVAQVEHAWSRIRQQAELSDVRLHDFRHTVGTYGGQSGLNAFTIRDLLGHKTLAMTGRYVERDMRSLRVAAEQVSERIAASLRLSRPLAANDNSCPRQHA